MTALGVMPKTLTSGQKLEQFLTKFALKKNVSAATQNQSFNAGLFSALARRLNPKRRMGRAVLVSGGLR
jgi:hypothetical protein